MDGRDLDVAFGRSAVGEEDEGGSGRVFCAERGRKSKEVSGRQHPFTHAHPTYKTSKVWGDLGWSHGGLLLNLGVVVGNRLGFRFTHNR